jgi:hypothetical protein
LFLFPLLLFVSREKEKSLLLASLKSFTVEENIKDRLKKGRRLLFEVR